MTSLKLFLVRLSPMLALLLTTQLFTIAAQGQELPPERIAAASSIWQRQKTPNIGEANLLLALSADSPDDIWSVGDFVSLQFNGSTWTAIPLAALQLQEPNEATMNGVSAITPTDVWAVGTTLEETEAGGSHEIGMIENYNGTEWSIVTSPQFDSGVELNAIQALSSTDIYAVGGSNADAQQPNPLLEHYDGTSWSVITLPSLGQGQTGTMRGIAAISDSDIWITGDSGGVVPTAIVAMHFNGTQWNIVTLPMPANGKVHDLKFGAGMAAIASNDIWAVGDFTPLSTLVTETLTEHWNGTAWKIMPSPNGGPGSSSSVLRGVSAVSSNDVWACGQVLGSKGFVNLIEHWNGTKWTISPVAGGNGFAGLNAMLAFSSSSVFAAGGDLGLNDVIISVIFHTSQGK